MGYSAAGLAVIGVRLPLSSFWHTRRERGCEHARNENAKFCSECGKPTWVEITEGPLGSGEIRQLIPKELRDLGITAVTTGTDSAEVYIGRVAGMGRMTEFLDDVVRDQPLSPRIVEHIRARIMDAYPNAPFGVWGVLYESY